MTKSAASQTLTRDGRPYVQWQRYWTPLHTVPETEHGGYLREPFYTSSYSQAPVRVANHDVRTYADLAATPCLILLGEPGAGKSTEIAHFEESEAVWVDLGAVGGESGFADALARHPRVRAWRDDGDALTLLVDAYDEALLRVDAAAVLLQDALVDQLPPHLRPERAQSLRLRITSRAGVWPESVTEAFQSLWGTDAVGVYTLAPLRRSDAALAAETLGIPPGPFLTAVADAGAGSWASLPLTLFWLLGIYQRDGAFPDTRRELFETAARFLCEEHNRRRLAADRHGLLTPGQRLALAGRIAAMMRFGDRATLSLRSVGAHPEGALAGEEVEGTETDLGGASFTIGPGSLRDLARDTGLFRTAGPHVFRWTQGAVADFLAAWYLNHRHAQPVQALSLVTDPDDHHIVPPLRNVAAWTAALIPEVFLALAEREPNIALGGDPQSLDPDVLRQGVDLYLGAIGDERLHTFTDPVPETYRGFRHPALAEQVLGWMSDASRPERARSEAIRIGVQNELSELADPVISLALNADAPLDLRVSALYAAGHLAPPDALAALRPLACIPGEEAEWVRRTARNVLWPSVLSFSELVASVALTPEDDADSFASGLLSSPPFSVDAVDDALLVEALDWVAEGQDPSTHVIAQGAIAAAAARAHVPEIGRRLAPLLVRLATRDDELYALRTREHDVQRALASGDEDRTVFLAALVTAAADVDVPNTIVWRLLHDASPVRHQDVSVLLELLRNAEDDTVRDVCATFLGSLAHPPDSSTLDRVAALLYDAASTLPRVQAIVKRSYEAWDLSDPDVQATREAWGPGRPGPEPLDPPIPARLDDDLAQPIKDRWRHVCHTLNLNPENNTHYPRDPFQPDLTAYPGWGALGAADQERVFEAAREAIESSVPDAADWTSVEEGNLTWHLLDGVRALALLDGHEVELDDAVWSAWAPALLARVEDGSVERADLIRGLIAQAYRADPQAFRDNAARIIPLLPARLGAFDRALAPLGDPALNALLLDATASEDASDYDRHQVLRRLVEEKVPGAAAAVVRRVRSAYDPHRAASWIRLHLSADPVPAWAAHRECVLSNDAVISAILTQIADESRHAPLSAETPPEALVALETSLHRLFPPDDDPPQPKGVYSPSMADNIRDLRGGFAAILAAQGTEEAVEAIESLRAVLSPHTLRYQIKRARTRRRELCHRVLSPVRLLALLDRPETRLVRSADELFQVTTETLNGFEEWLRTGTAPRVYALWNHVPRREALHLAASIVRASGAPDALADELDALRTGANPAFAFPRDEGALANAALRFLRERLGPQGILIVREAEVQRGHAVDLVVSVPATDVGPAATVVIEVKASWYGKLYSALADQLADRYLDGVMRRHGIYLVGWYGPQGWYERAPGTPHPKAASARKGGLDALRAKLNAAALDACTDGRQLASLVVDVSLPPPRASA